jgi:ferrous iron transport protein B
MSALYKIALAGNPNSGKSSLFNSLTGLQQKVGNFPGVTVDKKTGRSQIDSHLHAEIIDLPGAYSLYPGSADEFVAYEVLLKPGDAQPDLIIVVADAANLRRSLLYCSQIIDLKIPVLVALTMMDLAASKGMQPDVATLQYELGVPVVVVNPRRDEGIDALKKAIIRIKSAPGTAVADFIAFPEDAGRLANKVMEITGVPSLYGALHLATNINSIGFFSESVQNKIGQAVNVTGFSSGKWQAEEVLARYQRISSILSKVQKGTTAKKRGFTEKLDRILLHRIWGNLILLLVLLLMFQTIFWLASYPMDWIEQGFAWLQNSVGAVLPETWWSDLLVNGLLAGIGGVVIFVPQIALLFGIITLLEDSGYMARISFLTDRMMHAAGLNGRSVMPLISGMACAIPAVMATRTIENRKERLITIMVTPLMSCSARLPIYVILIALVIPDVTYGGFIKLQGLVMTGMYLLGFVMALIVAKVWDWVLKTKERSIFLMELPEYRAPRWKNAWITMAAKSKIFVQDAGKIILAISLVLWALSSYGPGSEMEKITTKYTEIAATQSTELSPEQEDEKATELLEHSYAGKIGKAIEPVIAPLGYDWKMGIALISSFAAREVFVGTMATLYSVGEADENSKPLRQKMAEAKRADGRPVYTLATGLSLMIFYAFAMQCMSTIAIVRRETKSWKWALIQLGYLTGLAYLAALLVYQVLA